VWAANRPCGAEILAGWASGAICSAGLSEGSFWTVVLGSGGGALAKRLGWERPGWARACGAGSYGGQLTSIGRVPSAEFLGFWGALLAFGGLAQRFQLLGLEFAQVARLLIEHQRAVADAANLLDEVAYFQEHLAQFAVAPLDENHFVPGIVALADLADAGRGGANLG
jgi:hypothetical protein